MRPTLIEIFGLKFHAYVTLLSAAFLYGTFGAVRDLARQSPPIVGSTRGGLCGFVGALLGAKIWWILQYDTPLHLWRAVIFWQGGMVFYGGLIGGITGLLLYLKFTRLPILPVVDAVAPYMAAGEFMTRIGCFMNGCCFGAVTKMPWAVYYPKHSHPYAYQMDEGLIAAGAPSSLGVHPTQLYMAFSLGVGFLVLRELAKRKPFKGSVALGFFFWYGCTRFIVEFFRGESARPWLGLTVSQMVSGFLVILSATVFIAALRSMRKKISDSGEHETA